MILGSASSIEKRLGDNLMSRGWLDRRYELRTNRRPGRAVPGGVCQNLTQNVDLGIIEGTIGWHVAYSLLRAMDSIASMGTVPFKETWVDLKLVLGQELGSGVARAECYLGMAHLTYPGLVRQIRGVVRVALPQTKAGENGWHSTAPGIGMFLEGFGTGLWQTRGVTVRVNA